MQQLFVAEEKIQEKGKYLANATVKEFRRQQELDFIKEFA